MRRVKIENGDGKILEKFEKIKAEGVESSFVNNSRGLATPGTWVEVWLRGNKNNIEDFLNQLAQNEINFKEELVIPA